MGDELNGCYWCEGGGHDPSFTCRKCRIRIDLNKRQENRYIRRIDGADGTTALVDIYDVLEAFGVTCHATGHAVKKLLCAGDRGAKSRLQDLQEAAQAIQRAIEKASK